MREFLIYLRAAYWNEISEAERAQVTQAEAAAGSEEVQRLVAAQVTLAKQLPDYWQRFEAFSAAFARDQLAAPPPKPGFFDRLRGR